MGPASSSTPARRPSSNPTPATLATARLSPPVGTPPSPTPTLPTISLPHISHSSISEVAHWVSLYPCPDSPPTPSLAFLSPYHARHPLPARTAGVLLPLSPLPPHVVPPSIPAGPAGSSLRRSSRLSAGAALSTAALRGKGGKVVKLVGDVVTLPLYHFTTSGGNVVALPLRVVMW